MNYRSFIRRDYKLQASTGWQPSSFVSKRTLVVSGLSLFTVLSVVFLFNLTDANANPSTDPVTQAIDIPAPSDDAQSVVRQLSLPAKPEASSAIPFAPPQRKLKASIVPSAEIPTTRNKQVRIKVRRGDTLAAIFSRNKLSARDVHNIITLGKPVRGLKNLHPGEHIRLQYDAQDRFTGLVHELDKFQSLHIQRNENGYTAKQVVRKPDVRIAYASGSIQNSLFLAGQKAGMPENLIMELAGIFGWDIDFVLDIRRDDSFHVVYEEHYLDGEKVRNGNILAAEFINQGKSFRAVQYTHANGRSDYYTPKGYSMRKAFLRTPVDFSRISSRFGKRKHPILNSMRLHKGVDYAAKRGTPVRATGDGKIIHRARKGGYGKTVVISHGNKYSTLYAHLSNYNRKARSGSRVKQGQVIGYVGSTGRATGPHLHYEFRVYGGHRNPLTVKLPSAAPIDKRIKQDFLNKTQGLIAQLDGLRRTDIAFAQ